MKVVLRQRDRGNVTRVLTIDCGVTNEGALRTAVFSETGGDNLTPIFTHETRR